MAGGKEIRSKIKSVENTRKITKAMEMVAASKMRKAQDRMRTARPYSSKLRNIAGHLSEANPDYTHSFMITRDELKNVGLIVVTTDKGLCGAMNATILRNVTHKLRDLEASGIGSEVVAIGSKGLGFLSRIGARLASHVVLLGDTPHLEKLIGPIKVLLDAYQNGDIDAIYLIYTRFINTMTQEPVMEQLVSLAPEKIKADKGTYTWDYVYEPDPQIVIDELLVRYLEALIYQAVAENMA
ncbi:MAG: F-type H+-transporting ATPase subunit gamma, partial [Burkholderiales bacterium]